MNLTEFIGFLFSFGLFIFLMLKRAFSDRYRRQHPEIAAEEEKREEQEYRNILRELDLDEDDEDLPEEMKPEIKPPPRPKLVPKQLPKPRIMPLPPVIQEMTHYEIEDKTLSHTRGEKFLSDLPAYKNMLIYYEIFGPPKAFRKD